MKKIILLLIGVVYPLSLFAEDIELYIGAKAARSANKPKVLLIFDNSGSMGSSVKIKTPYDHHKNYGASSTKTVYYSKGATSSKPDPSQSGEKRKFLLDINSCSTAISRLNDIGFYTGYVREYTFVGASGSWKELPELDATNVKFIDCWDDIRLKDDTNGKDINGNSLSKGYPIDGVGDPTTPQYFTTDINLSNTNLGTGEVVTLYSENYLRWSYDNSLGTINKAKMDIAKEAVEALIDSAPTVDFALEVFNYNRSGYNKDGGRVVFGFEDLTPARTTDLQNMIQSLTPYTWTPLCESLYESYRYFSGSSVYFGKKDSSAKPYQDFNAQTSGVYKTPYTACSNSISVILITDGSPTYDSAADSKIKNLSPKPTLGKSQYYNSYLPALAKWMKNNDVNTILDGVQTSTLYTVGFSLGAGSAVNLLKEAADVGGGKFYDASDPSELLAKLNSAIVEIMKVNTSFTAPSVASNNFDRTKTLDAVYYAMFNPDRGPRWQGNLKKLKIASGGLVDRNGTAAIDTDGSIKPTAKTFWSTGAADGGEVASGGVAEMLRTMTPSNRVIYSDLGAINSQGANQLKLFTKSNAEASSAFKSQTLLASALGVADDATVINSYLDWAKGIDVDDADDDKSTTDMRPDVFGDPLHSKPLVINYGGTKTNQDIRIVIGTNAGALHMFNDQGNTITEDWAFMPQEFYKNIVALKDNYTSSDKIYGVDGTPVSYFLDENGDGSVNGNDKVWVFFGLRRGGSSYYGLDLTSPSSPKLMWKIESKGSFAELGQSWSTPKVAFSKINTKVTDPVLIFGAGFATNKDLHAVGSADSIGRGVFMVDAKTGGLLWSLTPSTTPAFPGSDSIPSSVATMDSDSDGFVDRLYVGDTGGSIWRVDMPGVDTKKWQVNQLASLGGTTNDTDRRFFAEPSIARALITETIENTDASGNVTVQRTEIPYDAILIGSGDRTNPLETITNDKLFMIKDINILTQNFATAPTTITTADLYDYTDDPFGTVSAAGRQALAIDVSKKEGWFVDLAPGGVTDGEKNVAQAEAFAGVAYYSTFTPAATTTGVCTPTGGTSLLYAIDLALGTNIYNTRTIQSTTNFSDGLTFITKPDPAPNPSNPTPTPSNQSVGDPISILIGNTLKLCDAAGDCSGVRLKTMRSSLYITENN